jgi:multidrug resistance protein, MATE family
MFNAAGLLLATFGATVMAAHAVAINYAALMFMIPLSLNSATTIRVGQQLGRGDRAGGRRAALTGVAMGAAVMGVSALVMIAARQWITGLYTDDAAVAALAAQLLLFAAAFQLADGLQVCTAGALRGYKDTRVPMILCLVAYWVVGFPLAWFLGVARGLAAQGVWIGLIAGLVVAAVLLGSRLARISRVALPSTAASSGAGVSLSPGSRSPASRSPSPARPRGGRGA